MQRVVPDGQVVPAARSEFERGRPGALRAAEEGARHRVAWNEAERFVDEKLPLRDRLLGGTLIPVIDDTALNNDVRWMESEAARSLEAGVAALDQLFRTKVDPQYRAALLEGAKRFLARLGQHLSRPDPDQAQKLHRALVRMDRLVGPQLAAVMGKYLRPTRKGSDETIEDDEPTLVEGRGERSSKGRTRRPTRRSPGYFLRV